MVLVSVLGPARTKVEKSNRSWHTLFVTRHTLASHLPVKEDPSLTDFVKWVIFSLVFPPQSNSTGKKWIFQSHRIWFFFSFSLSDLSDKRNWHSRRGFASILKNVCLSVKFWRFLFWFACLSWFSQQNGCKG